MLSPLSFFQELDGEMGESEKGRICQRSIRKPARRDRDSFFFIWVGRGRSDGAESARLETLVIMDDFKIFLKKKRQFFSCTCHPVKDLLSAKVHDVFAIRKCPDNSF